MNLDNLPLTENVSHNINVVIHNGILEHITHLFEQHKALDSGKQVEVESWVGGEAVEHKILDNYSALLQPVTG